MNWLSQEIVKALGLTLMDALWQGAVLLVFALLFVSFFRRISSRTKYRVMVALMLIMPIWSFISFDGHYQPAAFENTIQSQSEIPTYPTAVNSPVETIKPKITQGKASKTDLLLTWMNKNANSVTYFWFFGFLIFTVRLLGGLAYVKFIKRSSVPVLDKLWTEKLKEVTNGIGLKTTVILKESHKVTSPITLGFLKPIIVFPIGLIQGIPTAQIEAIIAHEIGHIKRLDYVVNLLLSTLQVVYFFHPAYWWLYKQAEIEREYDCDQLAIEYIGNKLILVKALSSVQELKLPSFSPAMGFARKKSLLLERIIRITQDKPKTNWLSGIISMLLITVAFVLMSWQSAETIRRSEKAKIELEATGETFDKKVEIDLGNTLEKEQEEAYERWLEALESETDYSLDARGKEYQADGTDTIPEKRKTYTRKIAETRILVDSLFGEVGSKSMKEKAHALIDDLEGLSEGDSLGRSEVGQEAILLLIELLLEMTNEPQKTALKGKAISEEQKKGALLEINGELSDWKELDGIDEFRIITKSETQIAIARLSDELKENQETFEEALSAFDEQSLEKSIINLEKIGEELQLLVKGKATANEVEEVQELYNLASNQGTKFKRRFEIFQKYQRPQKMLTTASPFLGSWKRPTEPIVKTVLSGYERFDFNVTKEQARRGDYTYDFSTEEVGRALLILNGKILRNDGLKTLKEIAITDLAIVQKVSGIAALQVFPEEMETHDLIISVMTNDYASSDIAKANINMLQHAARLSNRSAFAIPSKASKQFSYFDNDTYKVLLNEEVRTDLVASNMFEIYGKRYSYNVSVPRALAIELYGKEFIGTYQGVFFPFIDGENSSIDVFYSRLNSLNDKIQLGQVDDEMLSGFVEHYINAKATQDRVQEELRQNEALITNNALIVLNDYVRSDLTLQDLKTKDLYELEVLRGNEAKSLYGKFIGNKTAVVKVYSRSSGAIEYTNVMDPRSLKDNADSFDLPPFQSKIETFDEALLERLLGDKKAKVGEEITVFLEGNKMLINFETQPKRVLKRYQKLYEEVMGFPLNEKITYYFKKRIANGDQ